MKRLALFSVLLLAACKGSIFGPAGGESAGTGGGGGAGGGAEACVPVGRNDEVRLALHKACAGCHTTGNRPFFASLEAFESGLVYNSALIVRGDPAASVFIAMIEGHAAGSYPQMPPGEKYDALLADGRATLSLDELKKWITELPEAPARLAEPVPENFTVRRLYAEEMVVSLMDQLGLGLEDFVDTARPTWRDEEYTVRGGNLFIWPIDWAPGISHQYVSDSRAIERFEALGGPVTLNYRKRDQQLGPSAMQTLVQMSQAWCRLAVEKTGNTAVLRHVTLADTSVSAEAKIKQNIAVLYLRMLGEPAPTDDVDDLYSQVYLPLETKSTRAAWTAVCASFVRHPKWLTY